jgi:SAM-dependent methyltransferase
MTRRLRGAVLSGVVFANNKAKRLAIRFTRWTGKSPEYVHPKHLPGDSQDNYWYLAYLASDASVLDVGCGHGMHSLKAARRCRHVVGVDGNLEIRRALRPGGVMLLSVPNRGTSWKRRLGRAGLFSYSDPAHKIEYTLEELAAELEKNGFRIAHLHPTVYDTPLIGPIDLVGGLSLPLYRRLTEVRRRLARRYPEENARFFAVCEAT